MSFRRHLVCGVFLAGVAACGCSVPYMRLDAARAGTITDKDGTRAQFSAMNLEMGGPRAPSPQAVTFALLDNIEVKDDWLRMGVTGQLRLYAYRWIVPCGRSPDCDVLVGGVLTPKSGPFHTVMRGRHNRAINAEYLGKNNFEYVTLGSLFEGDLSVSGPTVPGVNANGKKVEDWKSAADRPLARAGLFATASPRFLWNIVRLGAEAGGQYDGVDMSWFGRLWVSVGFTMMPSPRRVEDVPPYEPAK